MFTCCHPARVSENIPKTNITLVFVEWEIVLDASLRLDDDFRGRLGATNEEATQFSLLFVGGGHGGWGCGFLIMDFGCGLDSSGYKFPLLKW